MDYSEFITAIKADNKQKANKLVKEIRPRLISFLCIHMNADSIDAKDIAQDALIKIIQVIRNDQLKYPSQLIQYLLTICKNEYLKKVQKSQKNSSVDEHQHAQMPTQLQSMLDEEQRMLLAQCMQQLKKQSREFMQYWFDHPGAHSGDVAKLFDISVNNVWTRKHRLVKKLKNCYQKKSNL